MDAEFQSPCHGAFQYRVCSNGIPLDQKRIVPQALVRLVLERRTPTRVSLRRVPLLEPGLLGGHAQLQPDRLVRRHGLDAVDGISIEWTYHRKR